MKSCLLVYRFRRSAKIISAKALAYCCTRYKKKLHGKPLKLRYLIVAYNLHLKLQKVRDLKQNHYLLSNSLPQRPLLSLETASSRHLRQQQAVRVARDK